MVSGKVSGGIIVIIGVALVGAIIWGINISTRSRENVNVIPKDNQSKNPMIITSPNFGAGEVIPARFTCDGGDANPELRIQGVPVEAKSLVLIMDDPDAPGGTFTHWTVWNIDPRTGVIAEGSAPLGAVEGKTSFGRRGYGGPCPPPGKPHRYFFKLYALDTVLNLEPEVSVSELKNAMQGHIVAEAELMGTYQR
jgi:Raf kinase inhibitor-like YbhB/YbcL family protein